MRTKAWTASRVESLAYWQDCMYEAQVDFEQATSEDELVEAFNRWLHYAVLAGKVD